ncbi:MAG: hypothetical protein ACPG5T_11050 [Endozoicomonas sp.]
MPKERLAHFVSKLFFKKHKSNSPEAHSPDHRGMIEWSLEAPRPEIHESESDQDPSDCLEPPPPLTSTVTEQQLSEAGLLTSPSDYQQLCDDLGRLYMKWSGIRPRLQAFRKLQIFNPAFNHRDFGLLMRAWSVEEQTTWCEQLNSAKGNESEACRKVFKVLGKHWHFHSRILNAIDHIDSQSLASTSLFDQLQALSTLCTGLQGQCMRQKEIAGIINSKQLNDDLVSQIQKAWHHPEALDEINGRLSGFLAG